MWSMKMGRASIKSRATSPDDQATATLKMPKGFQARAATKADAPQLMSLVNSIIEEGTHLPETQPKSLEHFRWFLDCCIDNAYPVILVFDDFDKKTLVAYGALEHCIIEPDPTHTTWFSARMTIMVLRAYRRLRIASHLWQALIVHPQTIAKRIYNVPVKVLTSNTAAIQMLQKWNYRYEGMIKDVAVVQGTKCSLALYATSIGKKPSASEIASLGFAAASRPHTPRVNSAPSPAVNLTNVLLRNASKLDNPSLAAIYNESIRNNNASSEWAEERSEEERLDWLCGILDEGYPCVVAEAEGQILGYMALEPYGGGLPCYAHAALVSAFMSPGARRQGLAQKLARYMFNHPLIRRKGIETVIADCYVHNAMGMNASLKAGFRHVATRGQLNIKNGAFCDLAYLQKDFKPEGKRVDKVYK